MNNDLANWLRDFANANEDSFESDQIRNLLDAAAEIRDLRETVNDLSGWVAGVEADNDTLRNEIRRLTAERDEVQNELNALKKRIGDASILLCDWDGYYNPETGKGNVEELAKLIEEGYTILQGKSWRNPEEDSNA